MIEDLIKYRDTTPYPPPRVSNRTRFKKAYCQVCGEWDYTLSLIVSQFGLVDFKPVRGHKGCLGYLQHMITQRGLNASQD